MKSVSCKLMAQRAVETGELITWREYSLTPECRDNALFPVAIGIEHSLQ